MVAFWGVLLIVQLTLAGVLLLWMWYMGVSARQVYLYAGICIIGTLLLFYLTWQYGLVLYGIVAVGTASLLFWLPLRSFPRSTAKPYNLCGEVQQVDERALIFARNRLIPGSPQYIEYYSQYPENQRYDMTRAELGPALGELGKLDNFPVYDVAMCKAAMVTPLLFGQPGSVMPPVEEGQAVAERQNFFDEAELTRCVKGFARHMGAALVGITELNQAWVYSHVGMINRNNWDEWGEPINLGHRHAIVLAIEMDRKMVGYAPHMPATLDSILKYGSIGHASVQVAAFLANLGYDARAHNWRDYEVMCVPLAVDAGLGEAGRTGLAIHPRYGSRMRLAVVTTDAPLKLDKPLSWGLAQYCETCGICAEFCPSGAIPVSGRECVNGVMKWSLDKEKCFTYWGETGSSCAVCMAVCPWSNMPDGLARNILHLTLTRSLLGKKVFGVWLIKQIRKKGLVKIAKPTWCGAAQKKSC